MAGVLIYSVTCLVNGKVYVGKWHGKYVHQRWTMHRCHAASGATGRNHFHAAIRKYGAEAFRVEVIDQAASPEELAELEKHHILRLRSYLPEHGYNMTMGGEGCCGTAESRKRQSEARKGKRLSAETIEKMRAAKLGKRNPFHGKRHSPKSRKEMGRPGLKFTAEHKEKISKALSGERNPMFGKQPMLGKRHSTESRRQMSEARSRWYESEENRKANAEYLAKGRSMLTPENRGGAQPGEKNHMFGLHHSEETRRKISERAKAHVASGAVNPMQGVPSPMTGKKHSPEALAKMRAAKLAYWAAKRAAASS